MDIINYKKTSVDNWLVAIYEDGTKSSSFTNRGEIGMRMWADYQSWLSEGNEPGPEYTPEELAAKEAQDAIEAQEAETQSKLTSLSNSDGIMTRGVEDLLTLLIEKGTIDLSEIPQALAERINERKAIRESLE
jgi:hypothetical protein